MLTWGVLPPHPLNATLLSLYKGWSLDTGGLNLRQVWDIIGLL